MSDTNTNTEAARAHNELVQSCYDALFEEILKRLSEVWKWYFANKDREDFDIGKQPHAEYMMYRGNMCVVSLEALGEWLKESWPELDKQLDLDFAAYLEALEKIIDKKYAFRTVSACKSLWLFIDVKIIARYLKGLSAEKIKELGWEEIMKECRH